MSGPAMPRARTAPKDGKVLCLSCGRRCDGMFSANDHSVNCPVRKSMQDKP